MKMGLGYLIVFVLWISSPATAQEKIKFPVSASSKTLGYSPLWVAQKQGFFDRQGLDVQVVLVAGADKSTMALLGGSVYVSTGGTDTVIAAVEQGADLVSVGGIINGLPHYIMGGKKFRTFESLRGANVGSSGLTSGTAFGFCAPRDLNIRAITTLSMSAAPPRLFYP